ncbi:hypothetical protein BHE74_00056050 [Ensete ventricosum]|nr:hypothetical protein BHE74_00056050 [Ensete ventricosum]
MIQKMHEEAEKVWVPELSRIMKETEEPFVNVIYDSDPLPRLFWDNVVLIGDAAHPTTPHGLRSTNMSIQDVGILGYCLEKWGLEHLSMALEEFQRIRLPVVSKQVLHSRKLGRLKQGLVVNGQETFDPMTATPEECQQLQQRRIPYFEEINSSIDENKAIIVVASIIGHLVCILCFGAPTTRENVACALLRLAQLDDLHLAIDGSGVIPALVALLEIGGSHGKDVAIVLFTLLASKDNSSLIVEITILRYVPYSIRMPRPRFDASRIAAGSDVVVSVSYGVKCGGSPQINSLSFDSWQILHNSIQPGKLLDLATHVATLSHVRASFSARPPHPITTC